jgi:catechol 2,3-dioxygenase-like lactoylglutathione lyase family enzyme
MSVIGGHAACKRFQTILKETMHHDFAFTPRSNHHSYRRRKPRRAFYCDLLGLREIEKPASLKANGGFWLALVDQQIHLGVEDGVDRTRSKAHLAYQVDDITAWRARMTAANIAIAEQTPIEGQIRFEIRDPFGNRIEFTQA